MTDEVGKVKDRKPRTQTWRPLIGICGRRLRGRDATLLIRHGASVKTVQERFGHASAVETLDTYSQPWPDSDERTRDGGRGAVRADSPRSEIEAASRFPRQKG